MDRVNIGMESHGTNLPEEILDSRLISGASGIPEEVVREKFGIRQVRKAKTGESVKDMAVKAGRDALKGVDPRTLDLVVYCGSEYKDYYLYNCAAAVQYELGAVNANAFEIHSLCSAGAYSLKVLKSMMQTDPSLQRVLLVSSSRESDLLDYQNERSRFMFNFGDGAAAVLLRRDWNQNVVLETHMITDGQFAEDVAVHQVGCRAFDGGLSGAAPPRYILDVPDIKGMKSRLDPVTLENFIKVIETAALKSGYQRNQVNYLAAIFMKRSILLNILAYFSLTEENSVVLEEFGHCQSSDAFLSLAEGLRLGRLHPGDLAVLFGAGTGYTWAATAVKWGPYEKGEKNAFTE